MLLIANLLLFPVSFLMFICNLSLHRKKRDFRDSLPLVTLNGCAQSIFSRGEWNHDWKAPKWTAWIKLSVSQTSEGDDSRTYASIDKSTREAKDIEYEIPVPTQRYVNMSPSENVSKAIGDFLLDI